MTKLNFGCNSWKIPWFINIDADPVVNPDMVFDVLDTLPFEDNSIEEIYAGHLLEHISWDENDKVLSEWKRVLIPWGKITITVPDVETGLEELRKWAITLEWYQQIVFWAYDRARQAHHQAFTRDILFNLISKYFNEARIVCWQEVWTIQDWWLIVADVLWQTIITANK